MDIANISNYENLRSGDKCYYFLEYTGGQGYQGSEANSSILNFKKSVTKAGTKEYEYKQEEIERAAQKIEAWFGEFLGEVVLVPIPPSKTTQNPEYDDRMSRVLHLVEELAKKNGIQTKMLELIQQTEDMEPFHTSERRPTVAELKKIYKPIIPPDKFEELSAGKRILVFDDVLTKGTHFKAMQEIIWGVYKREIIGIFLAVTVPPTPSIERPSQN